MKDPIADQRNAFKPFYVTLGDKNVADIVITNHAAARWSDRIARRRTGYGEICNYLWRQLKRGSVQSYYRNEQDVYLIEDDLVMVAEFSSLDALQDMDGSPLHKMVVVTFLGRMSETIELRDLKSYYSWLRHSRRMTLIKNNRKRK